MHRNRGLAVLLALLFGWFGVHKFYVGQVGRGFVYMLFSWTFIPFLFSLIDVVRWSFMSNAQFDSLYP